MEQESRRAGMNHSMWIISACFGAIIGRAIYENDLRYVIPAVIGVIVEVLIVAGIWTP